MSSIISFRIKRLLIATLLLVIFGGIVQYVYAGAGQSARGWAFSGTDSTDGTYHGMGWISFNDLNPGSLGGTYGVNIPTANGNLSGYAYSGNGTVPEDGYGWISFNGADLAGCVPALAQATRTGNNITGGARIISICDGNGDGDCRDAGVDNLFTNSGGFDGCVSLAGAGYGVSVTGASMDQLTGYAWSSDLGWINFGPDNGQGGVTFVNPGHMLTVTPAGSGAGTIMSAPAGINCGVDCSESYAIGTVVTLSATPNGSSQFDSWSGCDSVMGTNCTVTMNGVKNVTATFKAFCAANPNLNNCVLPNALDGQTVNVACVATHTGTCNYTCNGSTWSENSNSCVVTPLPPSILIEAEPALIRNGETTDIRVKITDATSNLNCSVLGVSGSPSFNHVANVAQQTYGPFVTKNLTSAQIVLVECTNVLLPAVKTTKEIRVEVLPTMQEI
ncbi:MAG: hypothetical protein KBC35_03070 [Candidatus Pacebacteria bacterium]|nr:hypothetical protein [Candidatus Paceibacterota bacterium]